MGASASAVAVLVSVVVLATAAGSSQAAHPNPVATENTKAGTALWERMRPAGGQTIEGYASEVSVLPGGLVHIHVSVTPAARYRIRLYRVGWYAGAGGRLVACAPACKSDELGEPQPVGTPDPTTGLLAETWPVTDVLRVPKDAVSGYYVIDLILTGGAGSGPAGWIPLVVRAPAARHAAIEVVVPVNTWEAFNAWGGRNLYWDYDGSGRGSNHVSFDRPYSHETQNMFWYELPLVRFLEAGGWDVSYTTDVDVDADPGQLFGHKLVMVVGHSEYWTSAIRAAYDAVERDRGNLAFMGANDGYWQMRYADDRRTIVEYRKTTLDTETDDPALKTMRFRALKPQKPECALEGAELDDTPGSSTIGSGGAYTVTAAATSDPWFAGTGFAPGDVLPGLVGYEWDAVVPGCVDPNNESVLFHYSGPPHSGDAVRYRPQGGGTVFNAGSFQFSWGLDPANANQVGDQRLRLFMTNVLRSLTGSG